MMPTLLSLLPWIKAVHFASLFVWCACLFALPVLLAMYPGFRGRLDGARVRAASRFAYIAVASPAAVLTVASGTLMIHPTGSYGAWMLAKLTLVAAMVFFHIGCGRLLLALMKRPRLLGAGWLQALAVVPALLIPGVLWLVLGQPQWP